MNNRCYRKIIIFTVPAGVSSSHPAKLVSFISPSSSTSTFDHWGLCIRNFDNVDSPNPQYCDQSFELDKAGGVVFIKTRKWGDRVKEGDASRMKFEHLKSVTVKNNIEIESFGESSLAINDM